MRSRHLAVVSAALVLSLFAAACGSKKDDSGASTTTTPAAATDTASAGTSGATGSGGVSATTNPVLPDNAKRKHNSDSIATIASKNDDLTNLSTALGAANLTSLLGQPGPYTVFAPNNDGFAKLGTQLDTLLQPASQDQLANILKFHIVSGRISTKKLKDGDLLTTLQGTRLRVTKKGDQISIGNSLSKANIVEADIDAGNGVVHVVDTVLTPKKN